MMSTEEFHHGGYSTSTCSGDATASSQGTAPSSPADPSNAEEVNRIAALMGQAAAGDAAAQQVVDDFFSDPQGLWQQLGDLAEVVKSTLAHKLLGDSPVYFESLRRRIDYQIEELAGADTTPLERLAAERLVLAAHVAGAQELMALTGDRLTDQATAKVLEAAERRIQAGMKTLQLARAISRRNTARRGVTTSANSASPSRPVG